MVHTVVLVIHIAAGVVGVLVGPPVLYAAAGGRVGRLAGAYHASVLLVCVSAGALAALDFARLWWFVLIAAASYGFALSAYVAARSRRPGWLPRYIRGQGGAYIALWTAIVVVSVPDLPVVWLVPAVVGSPLVEWYAHRARAVTRPGEARLPGQALPDGRGVSCGDDADQ
jgi:hypothetical protein